MLGSLTPNLSIRLLNTSKAVFREPVTSASIIGNTSSSVSLKFIFSLKDLFPKILGSLNLIVPALVSSKASKNKSKNQSN